MFGLGFRLQLERPWEIFIGAALLALANATLGKILKLLALPLRCMTLGLFSLVINGAVLWLVGTQGYGFVVTDLLGGLVGAVLIACISAVLGLFVREKEEKDD